MTQSIIYQAPNGAIELRWDVEKETLRANRSEMSQIFGVNPQAISKHILNIYKEEELEQESTSSKMELVQEEWWRSVKRRIDFYNLEVLIAVWYRISSKTWTKFRQWATQTLQQHITQWYTINPQRIEKNYEKFLAAVEEVKWLAKNSVLSSENIIELIKSFSKTWFSLDAFDKWIEQQQNHDQASVRIESKDLYKDIIILRDTLIEKNQATMLFAQEKNNGGLEGILWNIYQSAFWEDVYPSTQSKASHLLYFVVKNHPFTDGNKRSWAFAFIRFLQKSGYVFRGKISPEALTAITLLIATSDPKEKEKVVGLVMLLLG